MHKTGLNTRHKHTMLGRVQRNTNAINVALAGGRARARTTAGRPRGANKPRA